MTHTIPYYHPDTDEQYKLTFTVSFAVKYPSDPSARFQEPEDDDELTLDSITDCEGNEVPESDFEQGIIQDMFDKCYMEACEL